MSTLQRKTEIGRSIENKMIWRGYTHQHSEVVKCIFLFLCSNYVIKKSRRLRTHPVQEIYADVEIRVDTTVATSIRQIG